ncbi:MAG: hypothetical protein KGO82_07965 [Bacteroidota bacterium]|nr:hypothetical protein [Bacteroidota bacterium]
MRYYYAIVIGLLLAGFACEKKDRICCALPPVEMVRTQTQCDDVWGYGSTDEETLSRLKTYLAAKNIQLERSALVAAPADPQCKACPCSKGFVFDVWANAKYIDSLKGLGFSIK